METNVSKASVAHRGMTQCQGQIQNSGQGQGQSQGQGQGQGHAQVQGQGQGQMDGNFTTPSPAASSKRPRPVDADAITLDNYHVNKRYLTEVMSSSLNGLRMADTGARPQGAGLAPSLLDMLGSPAQTETASGSARSVSPFPSHGDDMSTLDSVMSDDSEDSVGWRAVNPFEPPGGHHAHNPNPNFDPASPTSPDPHHSRTSHWPSSPSLQSPRGGSGGWTGGASGGAPGRHPGHHPHQAHGGYPFAQARPCSIPGSKSLPSPQPRHLADAIDGKLPPSPSDPNQTGNLRRVALLRATHVRTQPIPPVSLTADSDGGGVPEAEMAPGGLEKATRGESAKAQLEGHHVATGNSASSSSSLRTAGGGSSIPAAMVLANPTSPTFFPSMLGPSIPQAATCQPATTGSAVLATCPTLKLGLGPSLNPGPRSPREEQQPLAARHLGLQELHHSSVACEESPACHPHQPSFKAWAMPMGPISPTLPLPPAALAVSSLALSSARSASLERKRSAQAAATLAATAAAGDGGAAPSAPTAMAVDHDNVVPGVRHPLRQAAHFSSLADASGAQPSLLSPFYGPKGFDSSSETADISPQPGADGARIDDSWTFQRAEFDGSRKRRGKLERSSSNTSVQPTCREDPAAPHALEPGGDASSPTFESEADAAHIDKHFCDSTTASPEPQRSYSWHGVESHAHDSWQAAVPAQAHLAATCQAEEERHDMESPLGGGFARSVSWAQGVGEPQPPAGQSDGDSRQATQQPPLGAAVAQEGKESLLSRQLSKAKRPIPISGELEQPKKRGGMAAAARRPSSPTRSSFAFPTLRPHTDFSSPISPTFQKPRVKLASGPADDPPSARAEINPNDAMTSDGD